MSTPGKTPELYLIAASQAAPFVNTLRNLGAPVEKHASHAGMPLDVVKSGAGVIGERSLWRFLEYASEMFPDENLGYRTALEHPVTNVAQLGGLRIRMASSLREILANFVDDVRTESTGADYSLRDGPNSTWFHRKPVFLDSSASWQAESYVIAFIIQIVRICAAETWLPSVVRVCSCQSPVPVPIEWQSIRFEWGHRATEVDIDRRSMALPPRREYQATTDETPPRLDRDFLNDRLNGLIDRQIWTRKVGIAHLADELGVSEATCKRRLQELGQTYTGVIEQRRYRLACQLLSNSTASLGNIARGLGYQHQANFARAFKRVSDETPSAFRQRSQRR